jgi:hypothetical protein
MKHLKDYIQFFFDREKSSSLVMEKKRMQELSGIIESTANKRYAIQVIIESDEHELLLEHDQYQQFRKSSDLFFKHPENP